MVLLKEEDLPPSLPDPSEAGSSTPCFWWRREGSGGNNLHETVKVRLPNMPTQAHSIE